jgi:hypothetical protein
MKMMKKMGGGKALSGGQLTPDLNKVELTEEAKNVLIQYPEFMQKEMLPAIQQQHSDQPTALNGETVKQIAAKTMERMKERFRSFQDISPIGSAAPEFTLPDLEGHNHPVLEKWNWTVLEFGAFT